MIPVIRFNSTLPKKFTTFPNYRFPQAKERYAEIAESLKLDASTPEKGVESLIKAVGDLKAEINMPATISDAGVSRDEFAAKVKHMSEVAFEDQCVGANPSYPLVDDLTRVFWESYGEPENQ
jgi:acetaldehyde dehydrogenase/alcohol dehydrogenase